MLGICHDGVVLRWLGCVGNLSRLGCWTGVGECLVFVTVGLSGGGWRLLGICRGGLFFPESVCDVGPFSLFGALVESLVGVGVAEGSEVSEVGSYFDVVEVVFVDEWRDAYASAVPCCFDVWVLLAYVLREPVDFLWLGVSSHEGDAGDVCSVFLYELVDGLRVEGCACVFP